MSLRPNGLLKLTVYLRKDQYIRLHADELELTLDEGGRRDISRRIREVLDVYWEAQTSAQAGGQKTDTVGVTRATKRTAPKLRRTAT